MYFYHLVYSMRLRLVEITNEATLEVSVPNGLVSARE